MYIFAFSGDNLSWEQMLRPNPSGALPDLAGEPPRFASGLTMQCGLGVAVGMTRMRVVCRMCGMPATRLVRWAAAGSGPCPHGGKP